MWTAEIIKTDVDVISQTVLVLIHFSSDDRSFDKKIAFHSTVSLDEVKRRVKQEISRLEEAQITGGIIEPGPLDLSTTTLDPILSQAEIDEQLWFRDFEKLQKAQTLVDLNVPLTVQQSTALSNLRAQVGSNFKTSYLNNM